MFAAQAHASDSAATQRAAAAARVRVAAGQSVRIALKAGSQHHTVKVPLSAAQCAGIEGAKAESQASTCGFTVTISSSVVPEPKSASPDSWTNESETASACFYGAAVMGGDPGGNYCDTLGWVQVQASYHVQWGGIMGSLSTNCVGATFRGSSETKTWCSYTGNNTKELVEGGNWNYGDVAESGTGELRIYNTWYNAGGEVFLDSTPEMYWQKT